MNSVSAALVGPGDVVVVATAVVVDVAATKAAAVVVLKVVAIGTASTVVEVLVEVVVVIEEEDAESTRICTRVTGSQSLGTTPSQYAKTEVLVFMMQNSAFPKPTTPLVMLQPMNTLGAYV